MIEKEIKKRFAEDRRASDSCNSVEGQSNEGCSQQNEHDGDNGSGEQKRMRYKLKSLARQGYKIGDIKKEEHRGEVLEASSPRFIDASMGPEEKKSTEENVKTKKLKNLAREKHTLEDKNKDDDLDNLESRCNEADGNVINNANITHEQECRMERYDSTWRRQVERMRRSNARVICIWNKQCSYCGIMLLNSEIDGFCCNKGKWLLEKLPELPSQIKILYNTNGFCRLSRCINNLFCFSVLGVEGEFVHNSEPSSVSIMGRTYHRLLATKQTGHPLHWYIYDESQRIDAANNLHIPFEWISMIGSMMQAINPFVHAIKTVGSLNISQAFITIQGTVAKDEIGAIAHASDTTEIVPRTVGFWMERDGEPRFINILDPLYEPLQYPLFFPHGTIGWGANNEQSLTQLQWYRSRILHRFLQLGRLCGEYLVDMYSRVEEARLNYFTTPSFRNRRARWDEDFSDKENENIDEIVIPASFLGCRRWCSVQVADALALSRAKGHPTLFITMTTNPQWSEIRCRLIAGQTAADIPMVVIRCFHARLARLKELLREYFKQILYMIHVVEFQKRGLPHAHLVLKMKPDIPLEDIDHVISAELPTDEPLKSQVLKFMVHRHSDRCYKDKKCCWGFPKPLNHITHIDSRGYVQYRRRSAEDTCIVPYNKFLLQQLDCHITIDVASTVHIFAYLYGYMYKGFDTVKYSISNEHQESTERRSRNEIRDYIKARYLSCTEAGWRIMSYDITNKTPSVKCLPLHLPHHNEYSPRSTNSTSILERYFLRPNIERYNKLTYIEYNEQYLLLPYEPNTSILATDDLELEDTRTIRHVVRRRTKQDLVCRIRLLLPRVGEPFYLRQILMHQPMRTWNEAKIVNGQTFHTYRESAEAMGLLPMANEAMVVMEEGISLRLTPAQLRFMFAMLILDQAPAAELWNIYQTEMSMDLLERYGNDKVIAFNECLRMVNNTLTQHGTNIAAFGLYFQIQYSQEVLTELAKFPNHSAYIFTMKQMERSMNHNQREIYRYITDMLITDQCNEPIFIDGKAGTGKTYVLNAICLFVRGTRNIALPCGTTPLAALLYPGGRTAHSLFQIPVVENNVGLHSLMDRNSGSAKLMKEAKIIIWDEFPMANKAVIESVNKLLQQLCGNQKPFGNKLFVATGDFRQVAPVVKGAGRASIISASIKSSQLWKSFRVLKLHEPIRNAGDSDLLYFLDKIGNDHEHKIVSVDIFNTTTSIKESIDFLFPPKILENPTACEKRAFLSPLNKHVDELNGHILDLVATNSQSYYSYDHITEEDQLVEDHPYATSDFLMNFTHSGIPDHEIKLKKGVICHIMKRLDMDRGLVKNARVIIESLHNKFVMARVIGSTAQPDQNTFPISRVDFFYQPENRPWTIHRRQLPLRLAYSTTFNSCQGLTLDRIVIDLRTDVFAHGQLYTAMTRIRKREDVLVLLTEENVHQQTTNVVYKELLE